VVFAILSYPITPNEEDKGKMKRKREQKKKKSWIRKRTNFEIGFLRINLISNQN